MGKAKAKSTTPDNPAEYLDDESRWILLIRDALPLVLKRIGEGWLTWSAFEQALRTEGQLPTMIRWVTTGREELFDSSKWLEVGLYQYGPGANAPWIVAYREPSLSHTWHRKEFGGLLIFYVWRASFEKLMGSGPATTTATVKSRPQVNFALRHMKRLFPEGWVGMSAYAIHKKLVADAKVREEVQEEIKRKGSLRSVPSEKTIRDGILNSKP